MQMNEKLSIDGSAVYSIQFQGILDQSWADQFGNLKVQTYNIKNNGQPPVTTIVGEVIDQAALAGFLDLAYNLGLPLLSVTYLGQAK